MKKPRFNYNKSYQNLEDSFFEGVEFPLMPDGMDDVIAPPDWAIDGPAWEAEDLEDER